MMWLRARPCAAITRLTFISLALSICIGCAYIGSPASATDPGIGQSPRPSTDDGNGTPEFTDPPLPTFEKSPGPHASNSPWAMPDCVNWSWQVDEIRGLQPLSRISATIVVGVFKGYGPARWNTPSATRPSSDEYHDSAYDVTIVRDVFVQLDESLRVDGLGLAGAYVRGGELGCDHITYSDMPELAPGSKWVFFINPGPIVDANSAVLPELLRAWPIGADGLVTTDSGDSMSISELRDTVMSTPYTPDDPFGTRTR